MKKQGGITLIGLVITIIVLVILVGVSISIVVGNNGVLTQATGAVIENKKTGAEEEIGLAWTSVYTEYMKASTKDTSKTKGEYFTEINLNQYLADAGTVSNLVYNANGTSTLTYTTLDDNLAYKMEIDTLGNVRIVEENNVPVIPTPEVGLNVSGITKEYYGKTVDYTVTGVNNSWEIFYADSENIYLIARNTVTSPNGNNNFTSVISAGTYSTGSSLLTGGDTSANYPAAEKWLSGWLNSSYAATGSASNNMQATLYMLDSTVWNTTYKVDGVAKYVIGGPTLEMLCASYNTYNELTGEAVLTAAPNSATGYPVPSNGSVNLGSSGMVAVGTIYNRESSYWLACPSSSGSDSVRGVGAISECVNGNYTSNTNVKFRPVVCLESNVKLVESDGATDYTIQQ